MADIVIVGAGPTGLTAALCLHHLGLRPRILEERTGPSHLSRAVGLLPSSMNIFDGVGVGERVRNAAITIETGRFFLNGRQIAQFDLDGDPDPNVRILSLPQDRTEAILASALSERGIDVEYGSTVTGVENVLEEPNVMLADASIAAREVLGADGARSAVRESIGVTPQGFELQEDWSIADVDLEEPPGPIMEIHFKDEGRAVFMVAMEASRLRLVSNTADALQTLGKAPFPIANIRRTGRFRIKIQQVDRYRVGHVSLAGDAAHTHSPAGGRGMNLGIADAAEWAQRLVEGQLDGYSASRHDAGAATIKLSESGRTTMFGGSVRRTLALAVLSVVAKVPPLSRRFVHHIITS
ncbi:MAG: FAD-dependent monooxygenase [Pseudomonadota bacterium]